LGDVVNVGVDAGRLHRDAVAGGGAHAGAGRGGCRAGSSRRWRRWGRRPLSSIGLLARAINEIPMSTLQVLAPTIVAAVVAFKGFNAAS
jgi:hypothetical protein